MGAQSALKLRYIGVPGCRGGRIASAVFGHHLRTRCGEFGCRSAQHWHKVSKKKLIEIYFFTNFVLCFARFSCSLPQRKSAETNAYGQLTRMMKSGAKMTLIQSSGSFFAYSPFLKALQTMTELPLAEYLISPIQENDSKCTLTPMFYCVLLTAFLKKQILCFLQVCGRVSSKRKKLVHPFT